MEAGRWHSCEESCAMNTSAFSLFDSNPCLLNSFVAAAPVIAESCTPGAREIIYQSFWTEQKNLNTHAT